MTPHPFNWDRYWRNPLPRSLVVGGKKMARRLERFVQTKGVVLHDCADVGCGPAVTLFELARRMPQCEFVGFDSAQTVLRSNSRRAKRAGLHNLLFDYGRLPELPRNRQFDLVTSIATLHYVCEPRRALLALYRMVRPGGYLIFNYPNERQRTLYRVQSKRDPSVRKRFALVLLGTNLLSRPLIERTLHHRPESFWRAVGEPILWGNPCVAVPK